jgi:glycosyltransferase involved in cell wall biosynthesis
MLLNMEKMMNIPQVSVVIPLYNKQHSIKSTLESACNQTIRDIEIIVIDDGSTDNGAEICRHYPDPRICLVQQKNLGVSVARNEGIRRARADLIAFLDADDTWDPTYLETILRLRRTYPEAGAYATSYYILNNKGVKSKIELNYIPSDTWEGILTNFFKLAALEKFNILWTGSICVPKHIFEQVGGFCVGEHCGQDIDMWYRIALNYPIAYSALPKAFYHRDYCVDNAFTKKRIARIKNEMQYVKTIRLALYNNSISLETKRWLAVLVSKADLTMAKIYIINGDRHNAINTIAGSTISIIYKIYWITWAILPKKIFRLGFKVKQILKEYEVFYKKQ